MLACALYFRDTAWEYRVLRRELLPHIPEVVIAAVVARLDLRVSVYVGGYASTAPHVIVARLPGTPMLLSASWPSSPSCSMTWPRLPRLLPSLYA